MATTEMRFSELSTAAILSEDDILALAKVDQTSASGYMSYKATMIAIGLYITKLATYTSDLQTTNKTVIGAINELKQLIALIPQFDIEVVEELPTEDISETTIYMVPSENPETENAYDEFIYVDSEWEQVGSTAVDLSAYYTKLEVNGLLDLKESKADMEDDVTDILKDLSDDVTVTGNPVTFETINGGMAKSCSVTMNPIQDLHGYDHPWAGGNGKNKLEVTATSGRSGSVDFIVNADESVTADIPAERVGNAWFPIATGISIASGSILSGGKNSDIFIQIINSQGTQLYKNGATETTITEDLTNVTVRLGVYSGIVSQTYTFLPMIRTSGDSTFEPYSNICPISGWDGLELTVSDGDETETDYSATFSNTEYGGSYDFVSGEGQGEWGYIASYNGETLPSEWISDRDVYAPNTTPTTGAEVAYKLATPTTFSTTPTPIPLNKGTNVVSTDGDGLNLVASKLANVPDLLTYIQSLEERIKALEEA